MNNLRLRIEILQDEMEIESKTCYELTLREPFSGSIAKVLQYEYQRNSCVRVTQIGKRIEVLEEELEDSGEADLEYKLSTYLSDAI